MPILYRLYRKDCLIFQLKFPLHCHNLGVPYSFCRKTDIYELCQHPQSRMLLSDVITVTFFEIAILHKLNCRSSFYVTHISFSPLVVCLKTTTVTTVFSIKCIKFYMYPCDAYLFLQKMIISTINKIIFRTRLCLKLCVCCYRYDSSPLTTECCLETTLWICDSII